MKKRRLTSIGVVCFLFIFYIPNCRNATDADIAKFRIIAEICNNRASPFYINFSQYPKQRKPLAIGIFDSGTGGLTVLDSILKIDRYNNKTMVAKPDGIPDFRDEKFIYLGDKANMPYGRYQAEGKADFLRELVIKDVQFLLAKKYYSIKGATIPGRDMQEVKALDIPLLGIIDAGSKSGVESLTGKEKQPIIGVMATQGTCATQGYPRAITKFARSKFDKEIAVIQQAGFGLAAAIDSDLNYINPNAKEVRGKKKYFGPRLDHPQHAIKRSLWNQYHFSEGRGLLVKRDNSEKIIQVELNSVTNYIKYHVTHLVFNAANKFPERKINTIILGCTHYPFYTREIRDHFTYLKELNKTYNKIIEDDLVIIDPANALAMELYNHLLKRKLWGKSHNKESQFYISVPNNQLAGNKLDHQGQFTFTYKYGRQINQNLEYVKRVPFSKKSLHPHVLQRIKIKMPVIYDLIFPGQKFQ